MVKQAPLRDATDVGAYLWTSGSEKASGERFDTLHIVYKNGDHATIEHKYCTVYNFEINYFRNRQSNDLDATAIAKTVTHLFSQYHSAPMKVKFAKPLEEILAGTLKQQAFNKDKDFSRGLPHDTVAYPNSSVELTLNYRSLGEFSSTYSSVTTFHLGIGGAD
jgi:hypothetical protein